MKSSCYLIINNRGAVRAVKNRPGLDWSEIAVKVELEVPNRMFERPQLQARIVIPEEAATAPTIDIEVIDNIEDIVSKEIGVDLKVMLVESHS